MRYWTAFFSQTGSEILQISKQLNRLPDAIIYNTNFGRLPPINPELEQLAFERLWIVEPKPISPVYRSRIIPGSIVTLHGWLRIVPPDICSEYEIYNGHPGLITEYPELKGKDPQKRAYELGHEVGGCVIHRVIPEVDEGEILLSQKTSIANLSEDDIIKKLHDISIALWVEFLSEKLLKTGNINESNN